MSPVKPARQRDVRALALAVGGVAVVVILLGLFIWSLPKLGESGKVEVRLGSDTFDAGTAEFRSTSIAKDGPLLFSDVAGGERDIFVQHLGSDPAAGWSAFDARRPGTSRECTLRWDARRSLFVDPCDNATVASDGTGLPHYTTQINADGHIVVRLRATTGAPNAPETTTTSLIVVTGSLPR